MTEKEFAKELRKYLEEYPSPSKNFYGQWAWNTRRKKELKEKLKLKGITVEDN